MTAQRCPRACYVSSSLRAAGTRRDPKKQTVSQNILLQYNVCLCRWVAGTNSSPQLWMAPAFQPHRTKLPFRIRKKFEEKTICVDRFHAMTDECCPNAFLQLLDCQQTRAPAHTPKTRKASGARLAPTGERSAATPAGNQIIKRHTFNSRIQLDVLPFVGAVFYSILGAEGPPLHPLHRLNHPCESKPERQSCQRTPLALQQQSRTCPPDALTPATQRMDG